MAAAKKKPVKKPILKKVVKKTVKATPKKVVKKAPVKKTISKKPAPKKAAKPAPKKVVKKAVAKKAPAKKVVAKKVAPKKVAAKKPVKKVIAKAVKKVVKKIVAKKPIAKKAAPKKVVAKKVIKKVTTKKIVAKKAAKPVKKVIAKKIAPKKVVKPAKVVAKVAPKKIVPAKVAAKPEPKKVEVKAVEKAPVKAEVRSTQKRFDNKKHIPAVYQVIKRDQPAPKKAREIENYEDVIQAPKPVPIQQISTSKILIPSFGTYSTAADIAKQAEEAYSKKSPSKDKKKLFEQLKTKTTEVKKKKSMKKTIELPKGYKPTEKEEYMNPNQLEYFRRKLVDWKKELLSESTSTLDHLRNESWNEPDPSDQATVVEQTGLELRTRDRYRKLINKIDSALARIEDASFGYCEVSSEPIGLARLEARPIATMTIAAQEQHERDERMVVDEG